MSICSKTLAAMAALGFFALSPAARAEEFINVNGLPCGEFCREWMGIKLPQREIRRDRQKPPALHAQTEEVKRHELKKAHRLSSARRLAKKSAHSTALTEQAPTAEPLAQIPPATDSVKTGSIVNNAPTPQVSLAPPMGKASTPDPSPDASVATVGTNAPPTAAVEETAKRDIPTKSPIVVASPSPASTDTPQSAQTPAAAEAARPDPSPSVAVAPPPSATPQISESPAAAADAASPEPSPSVATAPSPTPTETPQSAAAAAETPSSEPTPSIAPSEAKEETAIAGDAKAPDQPATNQTSQDNDRAADPPQVAKADPLTPAAPSQQVMIVLAKPDVKSAADLHDQPVIVAGVGSITGEQLKRSFDAAGASNLAFKLGATSDVSQLWSGQVAAAIVAVAEPVIASSFHEIPGYRLLLVPLQPSGTP